MKTVVNYNNILTSVSTLSNHEAAMSFKIRSWSNGRCVKNLRPNGDNAQLPFVKRRGFKSIFW